MNDNRYSYTRRPSTCNPHAQRQAIPVLPRTLTPICGITTVTQAALVVRAGDIMQVGDALRLALELAEVAVELARHEFPNQDRVDDVCEQIKQLRASL